MVMAKVVMRIVLLGAMMTAMATRTEGEEGIVFANCELTMAPCVPYFVSLDLTDECCRRVDAVMYAVQNDAGWRDVCNCFFSAYQKANPGKPNPLGVPAALALSCKIGKRGICPF
jgi:hypothetical protein